MKRYSRIFAYLRPFIGQLIFYGEGGGTSTLLKQSDNPIIQFVRNFLQHSLQRSGNGTDARLQTLGLICILIIVFILLKNLFLYLSFYVLNPLKNKVVNRLRSDLYDKILHLPIG